MLTNLQAVTLEMYGVSRDTEMNTRRVAARQFERAYRRGQWRQRWARLTGRINELRSLPRRPVASRRTASTALVPLNQIVGSEGRSLDFDRDFYPLQLHSRERWIGIAAALRQGVTLPLVELVQTADGYFVRDGHHRISVARALGQGAIEALVVN